MNARLSRKGWIAALILSATAFIPALAGQATIDDYRTRLHSASVALDSLRGTDENESASSYDERFAFTFETVRHLLPASEMVESNGSSIEVDNRWLGDALNFTAQFRSDESRRNVELSKVAARLKALEIDVSNGSPTASDPAKDENKARMAAILRRAEFNEQNRGESALMRLWYRVLNWLRRLWNWLFGQQSIQPKAISEASRLSQFFVYGLVGAAILFALWKLLPVLRRRARKSESKIRRERVVLGERLAPDMTAADLLAEAEALARAGELRTAIRKGYIAFLCELGDRKLIRLEQHKTNRDYISSLTTQQPIYGNMQALTKSFERHWYGLIPADEGDWAEFRDKYGAALKSDKS